MSYDLMVFNKEAAPKTREEFLAWFEDQAEWAEDHEYDDPANSSEELRNWFMEMIETFAAMNGPFDSESDDESVTDYSVGNNVIYGAFAWSLAEQAYGKAAELAIKHNVGFFDASGEEGNIFVPENGSFVALEN